MTNTTHPRFALGAAALVLLSGVAVSQRAQRTRDLREIQVPGKTSVARVWTSQGAQGQEVTRYQLSLDGQKFQTVEIADYDLRLRRERFDPVEKLADVSPEFVATAGNRLYIVQYVTKAIEDYRDVVRANGGEIHRFLANYSNIVEMGPKAMQRIEQLPFVRSVTPFHPEFRIEAGLANAVRSGAEGDVTVNILTTRRGGFVSLAPWIEERGGSILETTDRAYLMTATISYSQIADLAAHNNVAWLEERVILPKEEWTDMDIAREMHGTNYVEAASGGFYRGLGVRIEDRDTGVSTTHQDLPNFLLHGTNTSSTHGTSTSGIVLGKGIGNANATGCMPEAFLVINDINTAIPGGSRYNAMAELVNPAMPYKCVLQTNSVSFTRTLVYNSVSANMDLILFDFPRLNCCQSQSNANNKMSRPEAWAKNVIAVGGINHRGTLTKTDDFWGGASIGPAEDGRIKPDLASYYDRILTTTSPNNYTTGFGGTSGATPIIAGNLGLFIDMWAEGEFGNATPGTTPFDNRPQNTTAKAVMINTASQWDFSGTTHNLTRVHQGWGHADLMYLWDNKDNMLIIDESDVLGEFDSTTYFINVAGSEPEFRATMVYRDPPGTTSSSQHRINDLDLTVIDPNGIVYRGNNGLTANNYSTPGGATNTLDTVENVLLQNPIAGEWRVIVSAAEINEDTHVETGATDADYALVVSGLDNVGASCAAARVIHRTAGSNPDVFTATAPVIGQNVDFTVDTQGRGFATIIGTLLPARRPTDGGFALVSPETFLFTTGRVAGPIAQASMVVGADASMCGMTVFCQARLDDGQGTQFQMTNAQDLVVGN